MSLVDKIGNELSDKISPKIINKITLFVEDGCLFIAENNHKKIHMEISMLVKKDKINLIIQNDGKPFSLAGDDVPNSLRKYVIDSFMANNSYNGKQFYKSAFNIGINKHYFEFRLR